MVCTVFLSLSAPVGAEPIEKVKRGLTDIVKSPLEIVENVKMETKDSFLPFGFSGGLLKGVFYMGKKLVGGVLDVVKFPIE